VYKLFIAPTGVLKWCF